MSNQSGDLRTKIVKYWNDNKLSSPESSTSQAHPDLAFFDNAVENRRLKASVMRLAKNRGGRCLDIGAGYGRFAQTSLALFDEVTLLEPSQELFNTMVQSWRHEARVRCVNGEFEAFDDPRPFDAAIASGVLYLYPEDMVDEFLKRLADAITPGGHVIVRDFVSMRGNQRLPSAYIAGSYCFYRDLTYWRAVGTKFGFALREAQLSRPSLFLLRRIFLLRFVSKLGIPRLMRSKIAVFMGAHLAKRLKNSSSNQTAFLIFEKVAR